MHTRSMVKITCCALFALLFCYMASAKIVEKILIEVNGEIITKTELEERLDKEREMRRALYKYDEAQLSKIIEEAKPMIEERMIDEILFMQEAVKKNIKVSDEEIQQYITTLRSQFDSEEAFRKAIRDEGYTLEIVEKERKRALLLQRLFEQKFGKELKITDEDVKEFYRENKNQFPGRSDVVQLKHIYIEFKITEADKKKALARADRILKQLNDGADFGQMARDFSDHELTKASGGDIGYFVPGMGKYDPMLEEAAASLKVGEISGLIESPGGYDIIKVIDIRDNQVRARRIHIAVWPDQASEEAAEKKANQVLEKLSEGEDFVAVAKEYSDDPLVNEKNADWQELNIDQMGPSLREAFDSIEGGKISQFVRTPLGMHIFKIADILEGVEDLTDDEIDQLREFLYQKRLEEKLSEYSKKLREKAYIQRKADDEGQ